MILYTAMKEGVIMYSFLEEINNYVLENGIPFKNISIASSYFPNYFNQAVLRELRKAVGGRWVDYEIENYELVFEDNRLQLVVRSKNNHTVLVIFNKNLWFSFKEPSKKIFDTNVTSLAMYLERKEFDEIKKYIDSKGLFGRYNLEHIDIEEALKESAKKCIDYISYLNKFYLQQLEDIKKDKMISLTFISPEANPNAPRNYEKLGGISRERVNSILSIEERVKILESHDYMYVGYANSNNSTIEGNKEISYLNYLYSLGNNKYALVMEPYSGTSYTKIMIFESLDEITKEMFSKLVKDTLELSYDELNDRGNIIKTNHTSIGVFSSLLEYVVKNSNTITLLNSYTRKKIENLRG